MMASGSLLPHQVLLWTSAIFAMVHAQSRRIIDTADFSPPDSQFQHLTTNPATGQVYVGARNHIYQLDPDLNVINDAVTGPVMDHPFCSLDDFHSSLDYCKTPPTYRKTSTDTYNKVLTLDSSSDQLVTCGSTFQGTCQLRAAANVSVFQSFDDSLSLYVAANDETSSTVGFVAPGPDNNNRIYVGTTYIIDRIGDVSNAEFRSVTPNVCSRSIQSLQTTRDGSYMNFKDNYKDGYRVNYVSGFYEDGYSYFLTTQKISLTNNTYISKIIQVCAQDEAFKSYVELPIYCQHESSGNYALVQSATVIQAGTRLSDELGISEGERVLMAAFSKADSDTSDIPMTESVVCLYKMSDIRAKVAENLQGCFNVDYTSRGEQFTGNTACQPQGITIPDNYCGDSFYTNAPLAGPYPMMSQAIKTFTSSRVTAMISVNTEDFTVAYLGMSDGHMKKVIVEGSAMKEIEDLTLQSGSVHMQHMTLSPDGSHIYTMTLDSVYKVASWDCGRFVDCDSCLSFGDPHCGWCSLENKCSARVDCSNDGVSRRWLSVNSMSWGCTAVSAISPETVSIATPQPITLTVQQLPPLTDGHRYDCVFGTETSVTVGSRSGNDVTCPSPDPTPIIPGNSDFSNVTVYLKSSETGVRFVQKQLIFYKCDTHKSCSQCSGSQWNCRWCVHSNQCVDGSSSCRLSSSAIVTDIENCPRLVHSTINKILIPAGLAREITLDAANLPEPLPGQNGYRCHLYTKTPPYNTSATRLSSDRIRCNALEYNYVATEGSKTASLEVVWGGNFELEDTYGVDATVYKCRVLGQDCSQCLSVSFNSMTSAYNCSWCSGTCVHRSNCTVDPVSSCPGPDILSVEPQSGPLEGGTRVTIRGSNLGSSRGSVNNTVTIGGALCDVVEYVISKTIICVTRAVDSSGSWPINILLNEKSDNSDDSFTFQDPMPVNMDPELMPLSGNTHLTVTGTNLNTGADIQILLGSRNCTIIELMSTQVRCDPPIVPRPSSHVVKMVFDGTERTMNREFEYRPDPNVSNIAPLKSFSSGGRIVTINGRNLNTVKQPTVYFEASHENKTVCTYSEECMCLKCPYPAASLTSGNNRKRRQTQQETLSLDMDGVSSVKNLIQVDIVPDPVYEKFKSSERVYKGEALILNGTNLDLACSKDDVVVMIGRETCPIRSLTTRQLLCTPPEKQPDGVSSSLPVVKVIVGNLQYELGSLRYETSTNNLYLYIGSAVGGGVLIFIIIIILIVYKRSSSEAERQYKKIQLQLVTLESNVRNECKLAFAELQTEVSDFTSDLNVIGIPFWDYKAYTFKVLFPSHRDHPILHRTPTTYTNQYGGYEEGIHQFNQLLNSKHFLLIFIRTLEAQKNFGIRDKAVVASLLMVVLQDKMEYATEILKALLNELVDRSVEKKHPKLMLRRTESVVEKLVTNWLSLCMFTYLKKHAGKTLFMLYKAIKHQTEKGPIDGITSEARYSLSEDRLLREKIEAKTLTVQLRADNDDGREPITCKMLDCDTITQAKEKALDAVYMNTPHMRRPAVYEVDLVWKSGQSGHLPLRDDDVTTQTVAGWKRVNTLAHYHVPDNSTMLLVPNKDKNDLVREAHGMIEITSGTSLSAITPIITMEEGTKAWHLVKHDDSQAGQQRGQKVISEIFLTRLLATKGTLQQYIDDLFGTVLRADSSLPPAVKYLFDFFDSAARRHNILDSDVVYTWKSNSLPLRFWVNIIKNPEFIFDISKSHIVDSCLSVIAQTFMDSCSTSEHRLGKDSPSNKLLFAKDIPRYRHQVSQFYKNVQEMPPVSDQEMTRVMTELSMTNITDFNVAVALKELYKYSTQYSFELSEALDDDTSARKMHLAKRFDQVTATIEGAQYY